MIEFILSVLVVFTLRMIDVSLYTLRIMMVVRGRKSIAWIFGFFQSMVFVFALRAILSDLGNWGKILGYAAGFATGIVLGMLIEERLAIGYTHLRIISPGRGVELTERIRQAGYAVTQIPAKGRDGTVSLLSCSVRRKNADRVESLVSEIDPDAFVTAEQVRSVRHGFWGG